MTRFVPRYSPHPFPLLLQLEWFLLAVAVVSRSIPELTFGQPSAWVDFLFVAGFGAMGLRLPTKSQRSKLLYTGIEFAFLALLIFQGGRSILLLPFLCLLVVIRGCLMFDLGGRVVLSVFVFVLFALRAVYRPAQLPLPLVPGPDGTLQMSQALTLQLSLNLLLLLGAAVVFVLLLVNQVLTESAIRQELLQANAQLRAYSLRIEDQATLQERNRIARDIHDSLGHSLTALNIQMQTALEWFDLNPRRAATSLAAAKGLGTEALEAVRSSLSALRTDPLEGQSLAAAVGRLVEQFERTTGLKPECRIELLAPLPPAVATAAYRILQEGLTNITRHAQASGVRLELWSDATRLTVRLEDDGQGFDLEQNTTGYGLQGLRERARALGGDLKFHTRPGEGCQITACFPIPVTAAGHR